MSGTGYVIAQGGTFQVNVTPSASATMTVGPSGIDPNTGDSFLGTGTCSAGFGPMSVTVTPVVLNLSGTIQDSIGGYNILIGQYCGASLNVGPYSVENYLWTVSGYTFGSFVVAAYHSSGNMLDVPSLTWSQATPGWYWRKDEPDSVSCTADIYAGSTFVGSVPTSKNVSVQAPSYSFLRKRQIPPTFTSLAWYAIIS